MRSYVFDIQDIDATNRMIAGGKAANLALLAKIEGVAVPAGFCVSTEAFKAVVHKVPAINDLLDQLSCLRLEDQAKITEYSAVIRHTIESLPLHEHIVAEVSRLLALLGENQAYAVRSSATAEDLPTASFAGQQDTYLNSIGKQAILKHISTCWASLFTERAILYRLHHGFDHHKVAMAVLVQKMVFAQASGTLFTADPMTSNRQVLSIDAGFGLGEALVSGLVNPDVYKVRASTYITKQISAKKVATVPLKTGGTEKRMIEPEQQYRQVLSDSQILQLAQLGRKIEHSFGQPQDIEWCLADDVFSIVQSRPITTLYPIPEVHDQENHVYVSVGHQQMMTDAIKPLGLSFWQLTAARPMFVAGGRLFVDVTNQLASPTKRAVVVAMLGRSDPLIKDALLTILQREDFIPMVADEPSSLTTSKGQQGPLNNHSPMTYDPTLVTTLINKSQTAIQELKQTIQTKSGPDLFDFIQADIIQLKKHVFDPHSFGVIMAGMNATAWINEHMLEWLGEKGAADALSQSVPHNITSQMGLALLDIADVIRQYPAVIAYLQHGEADPFLSQLGTINGGAESQAAISAYLNTYGMRCTGEIDITKTRWSENPMVLVPIILSNIKNFTPNASNHIFEQGLQTARDTERNLLERLLQLPDGEQKAQATKQMIDLMRNYIGYREYPKYEIVSRYFVYKQALLKEAERLVEAAIIREKEDIYYLKFEELHEVVRTQTIDYQIINTRKEAFSFYEKLTPPRVMTSDGEMITGSYKREHLPAGAIVGLAVSAGVIEGRARVILSMQDADLHAGDILVTVFTDPSWTALFVAIKGLVTEVGGLMTHGAVIAREYGLPAVVGVENATKLIKDGQRIRVHGTEGYIEIL